MTHFLPRASFQINNEMIAVNIMEVIERTQIRLQTDRPGETNTLATTFCGGIMITNDNANGSQQTDELMN